MSMRVNELAKELGKTSKEVLDILQKKNQDVKTHSSSVNDEQINIVKRAMGGQGAGSAGRTAPAANHAAPAAGHTAPAQKPAAQAPAAQAAGQGGSAQKPAGAAEGEAPKKKIAAVYRPQNSQQRPPQRPQNPAARPQGAGRPQGQVQAQETPGTAARAPQQAQGSAPAGAEASRPQGQTSQSGQNTGSAPANREARPQGQGGYQGNREARPQGQGGYQGNREARPQGQGGYQGNREARPQGQGYQGNRDGRPQGQGGYQGNRDGRPQGQGYQGNRDGRPQGQGGYQGDRPQGQGGYQGNRPQGQGGYQGNRPQGQGGYQGNRPQGQGGYQGNRPQGQGGYQGNRPQGQGGYQGNRPQGQGGYQGNRPQGQGGYQGNRPQGQGGYQGNRPQGQGGYQGNRPQGQGGYQGNRDGRPQGQGGFGGNRTGAGRPGQRDGAPRSFDTPIQTKPSSNRQVKGAYKNDKYDKNKRVEDGPRSRNTKISKHPFIMPQKTAEEKVEEVVKVITLPEVLTIKELAEKMKLQPSAIVKKLFLQGQIVTLNSEIDYEKAEEIAMEYDVLCEKEVKVDVIAELLKEDDENEGDMVSRPPVVCVMGHVDHGKTSLLDAIRETNVTSREAGGITQHIGAYTVEVKNQLITFLDTPGHEAFTAMRMRGAQSTDIAILVVAADDGVMPQTVEAINHAKAAEVEIIVAINKIDKPSANIDRVKQELAEYELVPEDWGGSTIFVPVSAHSKEGIPELLEMILLAAEVRELKANPNRRARGLVIEAELDKGKGPVATILVQKGTLRVGDNVTAGPCYGKVRAMMDDKGRRVKEAGPSMPVEILGLNDVPGAGDVLMATENEKEARSYAETFIAESKNKLLEDTKAKLSLDDLFTQIKAGNVKELPIIVKANVQGSVEAVKQSLVKLSNEEVVVKVIHGGVGAINESDVSLASASNAIIIGFNVRPDVTAKSIAEREKVDLRLYRVIYQAIEDVEAAMKGMLDPVFEEQVIGHAVVRQTFKASGVGTIAGSYVMDGKFQRGCSCRITRGGDQIFEGALASLKRFKDDVKEVATGYECGLVFEKFNDLQEDDMVEAYIMVEVPR
ncbi:translation initiation factor IF-2 [Clostridium sp. AN503]|uniref:translation initiation factor IF-2 n=1 Tax=Clostridium sp. AN503 TaxID=3160598 RepID=UPI00345AE58A